MASKITKERVVTLHNPNGGPLTMGVGVGATIPDQSYGNRKVWVEINGYDPLGDKEAQAAAIRKGAAELADLADEVAGIIIEDVMPTIEKAGEEFKEGKRK